MRKEIWQKIFFMKRLKLLCKKRVGKLLIAQKENQKIAVEIKSFVGLSLITDFYHALGQYQLYLLALRSQFPDWKLYLAMPNETYQILKSDDLLAEFLDELQLHYLIFDTQTQSIEQWIN